MSMIKKTSAMLGILLMLSSFYFTKNKSLTSELAPCQKSLSLNLYPVYVQGNVNYIDNLGNLIIKTNYQEGYEFSEGLAAVKIKPKIYEIFQSYKWGYINLCGKLSINSKFNQADKFSEGLAKVKINELYGYINRNGNFAITPRFIKASSFKKGTAFVDQGPDFSNCINSKGLSIESEKCKLYTSSEAVDRKVKIKFYPIKVGTKYGLRDIDGRIKVEPTFDNIENISDDLARVEIDNKVGIINLNSGVIMIPIRYTKIISVSREIIAIYDNKNIGYFSKNRGLIWNPSY